MTEFNKGWWNCFISFSSEMLLSNRSEDNEIVSVLRSAGVTAEEIEEVLDGNIAPIDDVLKRVLLNYMSNL